MVRKRSTGASLVGSDIAIQKKFYYLQKEDKENKDF